MSEQGLTRPALVEHARRSIWQGSKSFASASRMFARETREHVQLLYAWCRACDDLADGQKMGHDMRPVADPIARVERLRALTAFALADEETGDPSFESLRLVVRECDLPHRLVRDVLEGFALDAAGWRPEDEADLFRYCYHVAGAVGCMMAIILGVSPDEDALLDRASDLGIAFQLTNISRDIAEDAAAGRCYLPRKWLGEKGIAPERLMATEHRAALVELVARLHEFARRYEASGQAGAAKLPHRMRWAVLTATGIYGEIGREVHARGERAWDSRVVISKSRKFAWMQRAQEMARRLPPAGSREGLWTRPRVRCELPG